MCSTKQETNVKEHNQGNVMKIKLGFHLRQCFQRINVERKAMKIRHNTIKAEDSIIMLSLNEQITAQQN